MPAPIANRNATRHGLRAGALPKGAAYIKRETEALRRIIEDAVAERNNGNVSLYQAALISSVVRWERHAMLVQRWLRIEGDKLNPDQRLAYSRDIARASTERDKCLAALGLNRDATATLIQQLYGDRTVSIMAPSDDEDRDSSPPAKHSRTRRKSRDDIGE